MILLTTTVVPVLLVGLLLLATTTSTTHAAEFIELLGNATFPEGILDLPDGTLLVGGFGDGSLQLVNPDFTTTEQARSDGTPSNVEYFSAPGENGMVIAVGFALDQGTNRLWVANFNFDIGNGVPGSQLKVFDIESKDLVATIPQDFIPGTFFNEVAIDKTTGNVYVSDTFNPQIWMAPSDMSTVSVLVQDEELLANPDTERPFGLNGLAITNNDKYLIASVMDRLDAGNGTLVRIELETLDVTNVELQTEEDGGGGGVEAFAGSDGMFFAKDDDTTLFMVNVFSEAGAIVTADFFEEEDYSTAKLTIRSTAVEELYNRPTASALLKDKLWTVNSQLNHIIDDSDGQLGTPPELPFTIVGVPMAVLMGEEEEEEVTEAPPPPSPAPMTSSAIMATSSSSWNVVALVVGVLTLVV